MPVTGGATGVTSKRILLWVAALALLFSLYTWGVFTESTGFPR
jgi:hypothetical protein